MPAARTVGREVTANMWGRLAASIDLVCRDRFPLSAEISCAALRRGTTTIEFAPQLFCRHRIDDASANMLVRFGYDPLIQLTVAIE